MRLEDMTPALVRRAVAIYLDLAWPGDEEPRPRIKLSDLEDASTLPELFARFEKPRASEEAALQRYTLRLGNRRYPFMKFVVQEYLVDEEYFFSVDTHDDLDVRSDSPDYDAWLELKKQNLGLKRRIEAAWAREGLPTNEDLRLIAQGIAQVERESKKPARLLVVDDESQVAQGLAALLEARGYQVELAYDGQQVLDRLERERARPDPLDYGMRRTTGEVLRARENPRPLTPALPATAVDQLPVLRARASAQVLPREVLFAATDAEHRKAGGGEVRLRGPRPPASPPREH
jgi:CheY-like chemotaxis protein